MNVLNMNKLSSILRKVSRLLGDASAVKNGRVKQRAGNRVKSKLIGRVIRKFLK